MRREVVFAPVWFSLLAIGVLLVRQPFEAEAVTPPDASTSRYMSTVHNLTLYNLGAVQATEDGVTVLDFGQPWWNGTTYGTTLFNNTFASINEIEMALRSWFSGYWNYAGAYIRVAAGTNNDQGYTGASHGEAWGDMVDRLNDWIDLPPSWAGKLTARGAIDIEDWSGSGDVADTKAWASSYDGATDWPYYNYGSLDGCSPYGSCNGDWTHDDYWYVSWGVSTAYPLPEIYYLEAYEGDTNGGNAAQWYELSLYGYLYKTGALYILGSFTQYDAEPSSNTPAEGWQQLYDELTSDWRTNQDLPYSTDITWDN
jgi:hypothetical protein